MENNRKWRWIENEFFDSMATQLYYSTCFQLEQPLFYYHICKYIYFLHVLIGHNFRQWIYILEKKVFINSVLTTVTLIAFMYYS